MASKSEKYMPHGQRNISFKITEMLLHNQRNTFKNNQLEQLLEEGSENLVDGGHGETYGLKSEKYMLQDQRYTYYNIRQICVANQRNTTTESEKYASKNQLVQLFEENLVEAVGRGQ